MKELDAADIPPAFGPVMDQLEASVVLSVPGGWIVWKDGTFSLALDASVLSTSAFPARSVWHLVIGTADVPASIDIYPDAERGPADTFPHQNSVGEKVAKRPWVLGDPCLGRPSDNWGERLGKLAEPTILTERLVWMVERFEQWCLAAAQSRLHLPGDHFEMPALPAGSSHARLGFIETEASLKSWGKNTLSCGVASLAAVGSAERALALQAWRNTEGELLWAPEWGRNIVEAGSSAIPCLWLRISAIPIIAAWQLPRTFSELRDVLAIEGHDLGEVLVTLGRSLRRTGTEIPPVLAIGFPVPETFGGPDARMHWLGIRDIPLKSKTTALHGFRSTEENRQRRDREIASSGRSLKWIRGENWASDQVRSRIHRPPSRPDPSILLIGAGALGSQVAEALARSGITRIEVQDADILSAGNLCRHSLDLSDVGRSKALALADRLNRLQPDMRASASLSRFPERKVGDRAYDEFDIVLDVSGENSVLRSIGRLPWTGEKIFISLSMTWAAQGLLVWSSSGAAVPAAHIIECFSKIITRHDKGAKRVEVMEGIGCWHPVFPANPADVQLWAAIGARVVLESLEGIAARCGIFQLVAGGGVEFVEA